MIQTTQGATVITGEHINLFTVLAIITSLRLEVTTGLRHRHNAAMLAAKRTLETAGIKPQRTKAAVLRQLEEYRKQKFSQPQPTQANHRSPFGMM